MKTDGLSLQKIVLSAQEDDAVWKMILRQAVGTLTHLGLTEACAADFLNSARVHFSDLYEHEARLHKRLSGLGAYNMLDQRMAERAVMWLKPIRPHLTGGKVIDVGCGSGEFSTLLARQGCFLTCADVRDWRKPRHKDHYFDKIKGNKLGFSDQSFDQATVLTVFHHSNDPLALLDEVFRIAKSVIFIESVTNTFLEFQYGSWIDWFYNRIIHYSPVVEEKIGVPCHFLPAVSWEQNVWKLTQKRPKVSLDLGIFQALNPEHHHLYVY